MPSDHMGVSIDPTQLASGALYHALDPSLYPQRALGDGSVTTAADPAGAISGPTLALTTATTGGTMVAGTYYYVGYAVGAEGVGPAGPENHIVVPAGTSTNTVTVTWTAPNGETGGIKLYRGATSGSELHLADVAHGTLTYTDLGSVTPAGAEPVESQEAKAGELLNSDSPQPVDAGQTAPEGEDPSDPTDTTQTEAGEGVEG